MNNKQFKELLASIKELGQILRGEVKASRTFKYDTPNKLTIEAIDKFERGDRIAFRHPDIPLPQIDATVLVDDGETIELFSTILAPFQHTGKFDRKRMDPCILVQSAVDAIPAESHRGWKQHQCLHTDIGDGNLTAAFDGVLVIERVNHSQYITSGACHCALLGERL